CQFRDETFSTTKGLTHATGQRHHLLGNVQLAHDPLNRDDRAGLFGAAARLRTLPNCIVLEMFCVRFAAMCPVECGGVVNASPSSRATSRRRSDIVRFNRQIRWKSMADRIRSNPLLKGNSDQERLPLALNEAIAETLFNRLQL